MEIVVILLVVAVAFYLFSNKSNKNQQKAFEKSSNKSSSGSSYGKWVGGGLGWAFGGPIGGLVGFMFGSMFDGGSSKGSGYQSHPYESGGRTQSGDFSMSLLVLSAAVMKADGVVKKAELDYVKQFFQTNFGSEKTSQLMLVLRELLKKEINHQEVSLQISRNMDYSSRLQLIHFLFGIALSDGQLHETEVNMISNISGYLRLSTADYNSVKAMFVKDVDNAYKIMEISADASDEEVKKAYKKMAIKYHPDKVAHLGQDVQKAAKDKFQQLNTAYEEIKKQRGIN
ncbi:MAG: molecular chaperone DnaJ [Bacteroidetes bacterium 4572_77]|nr:MAG: molecular chaperone DnaJ [Bacteroidetes bacterium 4572_77]